MCTHPSSLHTVGCCLSPVFPSKIGRTHGLINNLHPLYYTFIPCLSCALATLHSCGKSLPDGSKFCFHCGAPLPVSVSAAADVGSMGAVAPAAKPPSPALDPLSSPVYFTQPVTSTPPKLPPPAVATNPYDRSPPFGDGPKPAIPSKGSGKKMAAIIEESKGVMDTVEGLKRLYINKLRPLEKLYMFDGFFSPVLNEADFEAKPMVLLLGQYSVGKTSFIKYIIEGDFPGERVGPEPTTEKFVAVMNGKEERLIPGNAAAISADMPFTGLQKFGNAFLNKFEVAQTTHPILDRLMLIDTPGVLSGEKQRIGRSYEFTDVVKWFASKADRIILLFDAHKLDISDEFQQAINALKGNDEKVRIVLNKADKVGKQELMRIYGALMWSLGRVITTPEAPRVYLGSFWDKPLDNRDNLDLFLHEEKDLIDDLKNLPRSAAVRKMAEVSKRARLLKVHICIMNHLGGQMPAMWGGEKQQKKMMMEMDKQFAEVQQIYRLPPGDFPNAASFNKILANIDLDKFRKFDVKQLEQLEITLSHELPKLMVTLPTFSNKLTPIPGTLHGGGSDVFNPFGSDDAEVKGGLWAITASEKEASDAEFLTIVRAGAKMSGEQARDVLMRSGVPQTTLRVIWGLSDVDKDGKLDASEFALAKRFIRMALSGETLPATLPAEFIPPSKRVGGDPVTGGFM